MKIHFDDLERMAIPRMHGGPESLTLVTLAVDQ